MANPAFIAAIENGEICCICNKTFSESYERPMACENCGGEGVLELQQVMLPANDTAPPITEREFLIQLFAYTMAKEIDKCASAQMGDLYCQRYRVVAEKMYSKMMDYAIASAAQVDKMQG